LRRRGRGIEAGGNGRLELSREDWDDLKEEMKGSAFTR
jgi:hypothetical protein